MDKVSVIIVGAGVVGLAVAAEIAQRLPKGRDMVVLERHDRFGCETSSHNSEVVHAGMYYPTGSLKAELCITGNKMLYAFCEKYGVPHQKIGKLIIARTEDEVPAIEGVLKQGQINGVTDLRMVGPDEIAKIEPNITAVAAIYSPSTGIVDTHSLMAQLEKLTVERGGKVAYSHNVQAVKFDGKEYQVTFIGPDGKEDTLACDWLINCAGLDCDKIAASLGIDVAKEGYKVYLAKGEYFSLPARHAKLLTHLVYPPPLKALKGLGIHVTKTLDGRARLGPSAFYVDKLSYDVDPANAADFYTAVKTYLPFVEPGDLQPDMAGFRSKIQGPNDSVVKDFIIKDEADRGLQRLINLVGIESPGLTACLSIAKMAGDLAKFESYTP